MVLIFAYLEQYKNYHAQSFPLHSGYQVEYSEGKLTVRFLGKSESQKELYRGSHIEDLRLVVGKSGSGKTNLFQLLGEAEPYRMGKATERPLGVLNDWEVHTAQGAYFFLYAITPGQYYIECKDMKLPQFASAWEPVLHRQIAYLDTIRRNIRTFEQRVAQLTEQLKSRQTAKRTKELRQQLEQEKEILGWLRKRLADLESGVETEPLFWSAQFRQSGHETLRLVHKQVPADTLVLNCYDQNAFLRSPYPASRLRGYQQGNWVPRAEVPYQSASLWNMCRYIREYADSIEKGALKKQVTLQISNLNFEYAINAPLADGLEKKLFRFSKRAQSADFEVRYSVKEMFIHDLWVDYAAYLWKKIQQISLFPEEPLDETEQAEKEVRDYIQEKEDPSSVEAEEIPDWNDCSVPQFCRKLARHLDYRGSGLAHHLLDQIWDDIKDITDLLRALDDRYFTLTTFEMPVRDMALPENKETVEQLFERMEAYHPDDMDLFDRWLLPCHFTHLSSGELQYARVFGSLLDYIGAAKPPEGLRDYLIFLDEPDAYQHPELSRSFIRRLFWLCRGTAKDQRFQLFISTHSPLMLSDVSGDAILRLDIDSETGEGIVLPATEQRYFGANIHSILADGFFLKSTIGDFALMHLQNIQLQLVQLQDTLQTRPLSEEEQSWLERQRPILDMIGDTLIYKGFQFYLNDIDALHRGWEEK